jgi:putative ATP-binding cassette transporter
MAENDDRDTRQYLLATFWEAALGFWRRGAGPTAWTLTTLLIVLALVNLAVQYRLNVWNRTIFDALDRRDGATVYWQSLIFLPLTAANVGIAAISVYGRMTTQRRWRAWLNAHVLDRWISSGRYYQLSLVPGDHKNPEFRVAEDLRLACEAPIDFAVGIFSALLSAVTFIGVLWFIGGAFTLHVGERTLAIPGFLVIAAVLYACLASGAMAIIGRRFVRASENKNQAEAEYRYALTRVREYGESIALLGGEGEERWSLDEAFRAVLLRWRRLVRQWMQTTVVSQTSSAFVPVLPILLCAPKYVANEMTLGEVMQASSAFVIVQVAFNWLVDNYPRLADWAASARRLGSLLVSLDRLERADREESTGRIHYGDTEGAALRLRNVSVVLDDGTAVVNEADVEIAPGERVLLVGESGTGKSTLLRAISRLWPWGQGEILLQKDAHLFFMPQQPYVPLGTLRRATTYPLSPEEVDDDAIRQTMEDVGLGSFIERLDEKARWESILSGGEKQRLAFARVLLQRPDIVMMDEATAALDPSSQDQLMQVFLERLPEATLVSVGHRPELETFHSRKLVLAHHPEGARLVRDEALGSPIRRTARFLSRLFGNGPAAA